jgi:L-ascorbate metabolism protein UlaG (beta-lactamase superfamily)
MNLSAMTVLLVAVASVRAFAAETNPPDPILQNTSGKTVLRKVSQSNDLTILVVSRAGTSVLLDPRSGDLAADLIAVTHEHQVEEHVVVKPKWRSYEVVKGLSHVVTAPGPAGAKDVRLTGIAASHYPGPVKVPPDYVIYLLEVDGLRLAYFPCLVQEHFTPEQRALLGTVDVALISAEDDRDGRRAAMSYRLALELEPRVVIPLTHHDGDLEGALAAIEELGGEVERRPDPLVLDQAALGSAHARVVDLLATHP